MRRLLIGLAMLAGCHDDGAGAAPPSPAPARGLAGISPDVWRCDSIAPLAALGELLGGKVTQIEASAPVPRGVPHPCTYEVTGRDVELWTFDIDCRDSMKQHADAIFAQYKADSREQVERYEAADAGARPSDAGTERAPEPAVEVAVGAKALDHHGHGLIFIDDDAPCYVRVVGKDAARRLELARLLARNLTFANAPMTPRPLP